MSQLLLQGIGHRYPDGRVALDAVDLAVEDGEFVVLVGPSGCGKSTLLRIVAGLLEPTSGDLLLDGRSMLSQEPGERDVAMVFQNYALYPHMSVRSNLEFPLRMAGVGRRERRARVGEVADLLGLGGNLDRKPGRLSGGQMQRVALGRAIIRRPKVFLFDEPLSNLDAKLRVEMRSELRAWHERLGVTSLYVTHDQAEALTLGARVAVLEGGRLLQFASPEDVYERPATCFVAGFLGTPPMNLVSGRVAGGIWSAGGLRIPAPQRAEGDWTLGIRPHALRWRPGPGLSVVQIEEFGHEHHMHVCLEDGQGLVAVGPGRSSCRIGDTLLLDLSSADLQWFHSDGGRA